MSDDTGAPPPPRPDPWATTAPREALRDNNAARIVSMTPGMTQGPGGAYPANMVDFCGHDENYVQDVRFTGQKAMVLRSKTQHVHNGGSGGVCEPIGHAPQVRAGGSPVIRHGDMFWMDNRKTVGEATFVRDTASYPAPEDKDPIPGSAKTLPGSAATASVDPTASTAVAGQVGDAGSNPTPSSLDGGPVTQVLSGYGPWLASSASSVQPSSIDVPTAPGGRDSSAGIQQAQLPPTLFFRPSPLYIPPEQLSPLLRPMPPVPPVLPLPPTMPAPPPAPDPLPAPEPETGPGPGNARVTPDRCPFVTVCFYPSDKLNLDEYRRQLQMQEDVLNGKTPTSYLQDRGYFEDPVNKGTIEAESSQARDDFWSKYRRSNLPPLQQKYGTAVGYLEYQRSIQGLAALHRLDTVAGGKPKDIAGAGDAADNSQIGATMRQRTDQMDQHAKELQANKCPLMRVHLLICATREQRRNYKKKMEDYQRGLKNYEQQILSQGGQITA